MSSSNCCFLTCIQVSQEAGEVVWYFHLLQNFPQFIVIHTVEGFGVVNKAEIDVFLEVSCFFGDPADIGNLISGSSARISGIDLSFYQDVVMSRAWETQVIEEPHGSQFLSYYEPWQCKFNAAYLLSLNSPNWRRRSETARQKVVNGRKRRRRGNQMSVSTQSPACFSNSPAHWQCPLPLCSAKLPKTIYS